MSGSPAGGSPGPLLYCLLCVFVRSLLSIRSPKRTKWIIFLVSLQQ